MANKQQIFVSYEVTTKYGATVRAGYYDVNQRSNGKWFASVIAWAIGQGYTIFVWPKDGTCAVE